MAMNGKRSGSTTDILQPTPFGLHETHFEMVVLVIFSHQCLDRWLTKTVILPVSVSRRIRLSSAVVHKQHLDTLGGKFMRSSALTSDYRVESEKYGG